MTTSIPLYAIVTELSLVRSPNRDQERWVAYLQVRTHHGYEQIDLASDAKPEGACRRAAHKLRNLAEQYETKARSYS